MPAPRTGPPAIALAVAVTTVVLVAACSRPPDDQPLPAAPSGAACRSCDLATKTSRRLTGATGKPATSPWFESGNPSNGRGYESAVAYAVAAELGFSADDVDWIEVPSAGATDPGEKDFDLDVDQVEITPERRESVDFSSAYYRVPQVIVTLEGRSIAGVKTIAALRGAQLGAVRGSAGATAISDHVKPRTAARGYPTSDGAVRALVAGEIDGLVIDLPTALTLISSRLSDAQILGRLPVGGDAAQFGLVLAQGSLLTSCVSEAVSALRADGILARLQTRWLNGSGARLLN